MRAVGMSLFAVGLLALFAMGTCAGNNHQHHNYNAYFMGPTLHTYAPCPTPDCPACPIYGTGACETPPDSCGAFCEAGQLPVGWQYNWCDEYWLRPDSNL